MPQEVAAYIRVRPQLAVAVRRPRLARRSCRRHSSRLRVLLVNSAGDQRVMQCDVAVRHDRRRLGIGSQLFATICATTADEGRSLLIWETFDAVPAGDAFSRWLGAEPARVNRTSELHLADVAWPMVDEWAEARTAREHGYCLEMIDGVFPAHLRPDAATFHHIMQTAPRDNDLAVGDVLIGPDDIAELDRALLEAGRSRWTALLRDATGTCVGGTAVTFDPSEPALVLQQNTGIDPAHRGYGAGQVGQGSFVLERIRQERPQAQRIEPRTPSRRSHARHQPHPWLQGGRNEHRVAGQCQPSFAGPWGPDLVIG